MICDRCGAWTIVLETRKADDGYTVVRTRECANQHALTTFEVLPPIYRKAPGAVAKAVAAAKLRVTTWKRDAEIARLVAGGSSHVDVAAQFGVTRQAVTKAVKKIRTAPRRRPGRQGRAPRR